MVVCLAHGPRSATCRYRLMGRHEEAATDLTRAIELDPEYAEAFGEPGETYQLACRCHPFRFGGFRWQPLAGTAKNGPRQKAFQCERP
jgi:TPR repeat